ncbi:hypothetical protein PGTUg99_030071 [Puccinia graminis f. sp. tritici]|uniref:Uncharacterized protein n=1 Tax=Puccinia graminis f. sp. tritici TaxID=56615 RepID=A0A5B0S7N6_PUCGR|nr:hypothetical protein PGTUg99_030071 [Puccinia graminis f. sp. tritici]
MKQERKAISAMKQDNGPAIQIWSQMACCGWTNSYQLVQCPEQLDSFSHPRPNLSGSFDSRLILPALLTRKFLDYFCLLYCHCLMKRFRKNEKADPQWQDPNQLGIPELCQALNTFGIRFDQGEKRTKLFQRYVQLTRVESVESVERWTEKDLLGAPLPAAEQLVVPRLRIFLALYSVDYPAQASRGHLVQLYNNLAKDLDPSGSIREVTSATPSHTNTNNLSSHSNHKKQKRNSKAIRPLPQSILPTTKAALSDATLPSHTGKTRRPKSSQKETFFRPYTHRPAHQDRQTSVSSAGRVTRGRTRTTSASSRRSSERSISQASRSSDGYSLRRSPRLIAAQGKKDQASRASGLSSPSPDRRNHTLDESDNDQHSQTPSQPADSPTSSNSRISSCSQAQRSESPIEGVPAPSPSSSQARRSESPASPNPSSSQARRSESPALPNPSSSQARRSESPASPNPSSSQARRSESPIGGFPSPNPSSSRTRRSESPSSPNPSSPEDRHSQSPINPASPHGRDSESPVDSAFPRSDQDSRQAEPSGATSPQEQGDRRSESSSDNDSESSGEHGSLPRNLAASDSGPPSTGSGQALASSQALKRKSKDSLVWPDPSHLSREQLEEYLDEYNVPHTPTARLARLIGSYNLLRSSLPNLGEQRPSKRPKAPQSCSRSSSWLPRRRSRCRVESGSDADNHGFVYSRPDPPSSPPGSASSPKHPPSRFTSPSAASSSNYQPSVPSSVVSSEPSDAPTSQTSISGRSTTRNHREFPTNNM